MFRIAGSAECRGAAREIAAMFEQGCDAVNLETFRLHPKALWYVGKAMAVTYLLSVLCGALGGWYLYIACALCLAGIGYGLIQYVFYGRIFDKLFPGAEGQNVAGLLEPSGPATQQILIVGHHDSPYIFSFLSRFQRIAFIRFLMAIVSYLYLSASTVIAGVHHVMSGENSGTSGLPLWLAAVGAFFVLPLFVMMSKKPSPGAGDNLNATSLAITLSRFFHVEGKKGSTLTRTRLTFLSTDGEEIGQRGAMAYAERHKSELLSMPTYVFNIDSVYFLKHLAVLTRDRNCTRKLSDSLVTGICAIAEERGIRIRRMAIPFGGGGTDASPFAALGVPSTTVIGMPTGLISSEHLYHTERDTADHIEVQAVEAVLDLAIGFIQTMDTETRLPHTFHAAAYLHYLLS
jgi:hypothetical protein